MAGARFGALVAGSLSTAFDPATLTGILSWYRGKDLGAAASSITSWPDHSGRGCDLGNQQGTAPTVAATTPNSGKCASFAADGFLLNHSALRTTGDALWALASTQFNAGYRPDSILGVTGDWASANSTMPQWWKVRLRVARTVTAYTLDITTAARAPRTWTFEGSNDDSSWTTLDTQTLYTFTGTTGSFSFSNSTAYLYYRVNVSAIGAGGDLLYLTKVTMTGATLDGAQPTAIETNIILKTSGATGLGSPVYTAKLGTLTAQGAATYYPYTDGNVYDDYVAAASRPSWTPTLAVSGWRWLRMVHTGSVRTWYLDKVSQSSASIAGPLAGQLWVGRGGQNYARASIAEIFSRSVISDATDLTNLTSYFNTEHGLTVT